MGITRYPLHYASLFAYVLEDAPPTMFHEGKCIGICPFRHARLTESVLEGSLFILLY